MIDKLGTGHVPVQMEQKPLIVLDAQNVAMCHRVDVSFSWKGIRIAVNFWQRNGHSVIWFLLEYLLNHAAVGKNKKLQELGIKSTKVQKLPDIVATLNENNEF